MSKTAPKRVLDEIYAEVCKLADAHKYMLKGRVENSKFMDELAKHPKVGKRLQEFQPSEEIRHWIKDVALHNYSNEKRQAPRDIVGPLKSLTNKDSSEIDYEPKDRLSLNRAADDEYFLVARTTYMKWETGLRKILLYRARRAEFAQRPGLRLRMILLIHLAEGETVNLGDRRLVEHALKLINVSTLWA
jgi:hypothetical protein